jgi:hypothetical protein
MSLSRLSTANISHSKGSQIPVMKDKERIANGMEGKRLKCLTRVALELEKSFI